MNQARDTLRGKLFVDYIKKYKTPKDCSVLDIGCRYGAFTIELTKEFKEVTGIDIDTKALTELEKKTKGITPAIDSPRIATFKVHL